MSEPTPEEQYDYVAGQTQPNMTPLAVVAGLGAAFLVYRAFMKRQLTDELGNLAEAELSEEELRAHALATFDGFKARWTQLLVPLLMAGYQQGMAQTEYTVSNVLLEEMAYRYAEDLGAHINEVSADAIVRGYTAQVNSGASNRLAVKNVLEAFGVPVRHMRSLLGVWRNPEPKNTTETPRPRVRKEQAEQIIAAALNERAKQVGEQEHWNAQEQAKSVIWMYAQKNQLLPDTATRQWVTAKDELVCKYCGPMHNAQVAVGDRFDIPGIGKLWAPPVHINCRCKVQIKLNVAHNAARQLAGVGRRRWLDNSSENIDSDVVQKSEPWDERSVKRDRGGRFARQNQARFKERDAVDDAFERAATQQIEDAVNRAPAPPASPARRKLTIKPKQSLSIRPKQQSLTIQPKEKAPEVVKPKLEGKQRSGLGLRAKERASATLGRKERAKIDPGHREYASMVVSALPSTVSAGVLAEGCVRTKEPLYGIVTSSTHEDGEVNVNWNLADQALYANRESIARDIEQEMADRDYAYFESFQGAQGTAVYESGELMVHVDEDAFQQVINAYRHDFRARQVDVMLEWPDGYTTREAVPLVEIAGQFMIDAYVDTNHIALIRLDQVPEKELTTSTDTGHEEALVNGRFSLDYDADQDEDFDVNIPGVTAMSIPVYKLRPGWKHHGPYRD